jgi:hypothetical protein
MTTTTTIVIPESLTTEKSRLEQALAAITTQEAELAKQRTEIRVGLDRIDAAIALLSGQTPIKSTVRKPMSPEARQRISEALKKSAAAKKAAAAQPAGIATQVTPAANVDGKSAAAADDTPVAAAPVLPKPATAVSKPADTTRTATTASATRPAARRLS